MLCERGDRWVYRKKTSCSLGSQLPGGALNLRYLCAESPSPSPSYGLSSPPFPFFSAPLLSHFLPAVCQGITARGQEVGMAPGKVRMWFMIPGRGWQRRKARWHPRPPGPLTVTSYTCHAFETRSPKRQCNFPS